MRWYVIKLLGGEILFHLKQKILSREIFNTFKFLKYFELKPKIQPSPT